MVTSCMVGDENNGPVTECKLSSDWSGKKRRRPMGRGDRALYHRGTEFSKWKPVSRKTAAAAVNSLPRTARAVVRAHEEAGTGVAGDLFEVVPHGAGAPRFRRSAPRRAPTRRLYFEFTTQKLTSQSSR